MSLFGRLLKRRRKADMDGGHALDAWRGYLHWTFLVRALPLLGIVALHVFLFPPIRSSQRTPRLEVGEISEQEIRAPFGFPAPRPHREVEAARLEVSRRVEPVYTVAEAAERRSNEQIESFFTRAAELAALDSLSVIQRVGRMQADFPGVGPAIISTVLDADAGERIRRVCVALTTELMVAGIVDVTPRGTYQRIHTVTPDGGAESTRGVDTIVLGYRLADTVRREIRDDLPSSREAEAATEILSYLLTPNLSYDDAETEARRIAAMETVSANREYARNERILDAGVRVTREHLDVLQALEATRQQRALESDTTIALRLRLGRIVILSLLLAGLWTVLAGRHRDVIDDYRRYILMLTLLAMYLTLSALVLRRPELGPAALPIVLLAMLSTILFKEAIAARVSGVGVLMIAVIPAHLTPMVAVWGIVSITTIRAVRRVRNRNQFYKAIGLISAVYFVSVLGLTIGDAEGIGGMLRQLTLAVGAGVTCTALSLFLLPLFEALFEVTTDLTLLELSDLNHPLLRRMSLESPGTYHHSQVVGTLAEGAARRIGANSLLARVGANYHDIGKMLKPRYYVENQRGGPNAHDELSPHMSALVIAAHVKDGIELGRQWGLPKVVTDFIPEHHGTSVMRYFYHKALERDDGTTVKVDDFRYPGPKPQNKETAIVMLADGIEAGTRSLRRPTPSRIREMTRTILARRMEEGELDECGLTLSDLARIREAFIPILVGIHHQRVAYPGQKEHEDKKEKESVDTRSRGRRGSSSVAPRR